MKILVIALTLMPLMAMALDDSAFNGASTSDLENKATVSFKDDGTLALGTSVQDKTRAPAAETEKSFQFDSDDWSNGASIK